MGKHGFLTPKAISNRQKAKGLGRLRWYCQLCHKQCRDENGFKCHCKSEGHLRQMKVFSQNSGRVMSEFSKAFESSFLRCLSQRFGLKRVHANIVYNQYIQDKEHIHMTATQWTTLTQFVKHLGKESKCIVDETEKGWFIQYVDRDPKIMAMQEAMRKKKKAALDDEERTRKFVAAQLEAAKKRAEDLGSAASAPSELRREEGEAVVVDLGAASASSSSASKKRTALGKRKLGVSAAWAAAAEVAPAEEEGGKEETKAEPKADAVAEAKASEGVRRDSTFYVELESKDDDGSERPRKRARKSAHIPAPPVPTEDTPWLRSGLIVKVRAKKLAGGKFYKRKAVVRHVLDDGFVAELRMLECDTKLRVDQSELETVIPRVGRPVVLLTGAYAGHPAELSAIHERDFCVDVQLASGALCKGVAYEAVCKC
eukprot:PLAT2589.1.p1 GENE.PLAT2589.1~~PLAT2589.1.p1  ORF type:complete len:427 (+),score=157.16 PLAT2589.1:58-1338(+)